MTNVLGSMQSRLKQALITRTAFSLTTCYLRAAAPGRWELSSLAMAALNLSNPDRSQSARNLDFYKGL